MLVLLFSCHSALLEEPEPVTHRFDIQFKDGTLQFPSIESYTQLVEAQDQKIKAEFIRFINENPQYTSMRKALLASSTPSKRTFSDKESELLQDNDFLSSLLNSEGLIIIGKYAFKINLTKEAVFVLETRFQDQIDDLKQENLMNRNMMLFSTKDDVLDLLEAGVYGTNNGRINLFCSESNADRDKDDGYDYMPFNIDYRQDNKVVYQEAGIYFSLQAKTKVQYKGWTGLWGDPGNITDQRIYYYVKYKPKCRSIVEASGIKYDDGPSNELNYRPYESTRGLLKYRYGVTFYWLGYLSRDYVIFDGY